jgi:hypothetical protein
MTLGQSVYPDIALHISNYYINSILASMKKEFDKYKYKQCTIYYLQRWKFGSKLNYDGKRYTN